MLETQDKVWNQSPVPRFQEDSLEVQRIIREGSSFLVLGHQSVDGDAYGSSMALYFFLKDLGKHVEVINNLPITPLFHFLEIHHHVKKEVVAEKFDAIFICDCGEIRLIGGILETYKEIFNSTPIVSIDHHNRNTMFGTYNLVDTGSSSTCELAYGLIRDTKNSIQAPKRRKEEELTDPEIVISPLVSTCLLFGIIRDTNCFKNSIRPNTFEVTGQLLALGAEYDRIIFHTYKSEKLSYMRLYGHVQENLISLNGGKIIGSVITQETFRKYGIREDELGPQLINEILSSVEGSEYAFLIKETEKGENKISTRARLDGLDVSRIAQHFGGGGHIKSAGAYTREPIEEIIRVIEGMDVRI